LERNGCFGETSFSCDPCPFSILAIGVGSEDSLGIKVPVEPPERSGGVGALVTMLIGSGLRPRMVEGSYSDMSLSSSSASGGVLKRPSFEEKLLDDSGVAGCWCAKDWNGSGSDDDSS
jgi:hypothetical protein